MTPRRLCAVLVCIIVSVTACSDDADVTSGPGATSPGAGVASEQLDGRTFRGADVTGHDLVGGTEVALTFQDGQLSANAGCNTSTGAFTLEGGVLRTEGERATTMMGCPPDLEAQDQWLAEFLSDGAEASLDGDVLTLTAGEVAMVLSAAGEDALPLTGTTWVLDSIIEGETASNVPAGSEPPTILIGEDAMAELFTGCNTGGASVAVTGDDALSFGPIRLTKKMCDEAAMSLESTVLAVLESTPKFTITGERGLTLTAADGTALEFRPA